MTRLVDCDRETLLHEVGGLLVGDLDLVRAWLERESYPRDRVKKAAIKRLFEKEKENVQGDSHG